MSIEQQITDLENAIRQGVLTVTVEGKSITYRSLSDMNKILTSMKLQKNKDSGIVSSYVSYKQGL